jgi:hypothetical protein
MQKKLEQEQAALTTEKEIKAAQVEKQKVELQELFGKTEDLQADIDRQQAKLGQQEPELKDLNRRLSQLQEKINGLSLQGSDGMKVEQLEAEREALENEYRLLLDLYRELSQ